MTRSTLFPEEVILNPMKRPTNKLAISLENFYLPEAKASPNNIAKYYINRHPIILASLSKKFRT